MESRNGPSLISGRMQVEAIRQGGPRDAGSRTLRGAGVVDAGPPAARPAAVAGQAGVRTVGPARVPYRK